MSEETKKTHLPGEPATVSAAAAATGGIDAGNFIETDIDNELMRFNSDDTPPDEPYAESKARKGEQSRSGSLYDRRTT